MLRPVQVVRDVGYHAQDRRGSRLFFHQIPVADEDFGRFLAASRASRRAL